MVEAVRLAVWSAIGFVIFFACRRHHSGLRYRRPIGQMPLDEWRYFKV
jgi:hypothetical protein